MTRPIGVGFVGSGQVTQAIHLPTLATMPGRFRIARVMDVNAHVASAVAERCGAAFSTKDSEVYDDPAVEIVVICSPNMLHAAQVIAACRAGKRLVLCEKPLAVTRAEGEEIARVARETRTPIVVGTMHAYDPAYRAALRVWTQAEERATFVESSIFLPSNAVFVGQATDEVELPPTPARNEGDPSDPTYQAAMFRNAMLGLAIHDVPLVRDLYPTIGRILSAQFVRPFGYALTMKYEDQAACLQALMPGEWDPRWTLRALGRKHELRVEFPASYVLAGSSRATFASGGEARVFEQSRGGYETMWAHVGDIVDGAAEPLFGLDDVISDLGFALDLADGAQSVASLQS